LNGFNLSRLQHGHSLAFDLGVAKYINQSSANFRSAKNITIRKICSGKS